MKHPDKFTRNFTALMQSAVQSAVERRKFVRRAEKAGMVAGAIALGALAGLLEAKFQFMVPVDQTITAPLVSFLFHTPVEPMNPVALNIATAIGAGAMGPIPGGIAGEKIGNYLFNRTRRTIKK